MPVVGNPLCATRWDVFDRFAAAVRGRSAIDLGAHAGGFADIFLRAGARLVVACEPGPRLAAALRQHYADEPRMVLRQQGISDRPGTLHGVKFHNCWSLARPGEFSNHLGDVSPGAEEVEGSGVFDVELTTLDAVVDELDLSDLAFVKIDVDGYEARVLRGGERTFRRLRPAALIELSYLIEEYGDSVADFIAHIYDVGYVLASLAGEVATPSQVAEHFPWHTSFDMLMLPAELAAAAELPRVAG